MEVKGMIDYVHYLGDKQEADDLMITKERDPEIQPDVSDTTEEVKVTPVAEIDEAVVPHTVWKIMAEWRKEAEKLDLKVKQSQP